MQFNQFDTHIPSLDGDVYHMSLDLHYADGSLLFAVRKSLATSNISHTEVLWNSSNVVVGFQQINSSHVAIVDITDHCIRMIDRTNNQVSILSGVCGAGGSVDGTPSTARFYYPRSLITDKLHPGYLLLTDKGNNVLRSIEIQTGEVATIARSLYHCTYMVWHEDNLLVVGVHQIHIVTWNDSEEATADVLVGAVKSGFKDGDFDSARFENPHGIAALSSHMFLITDFGDRTLRMLDMRNRQVLPVCVKTFCKHSHRFSKKPYSLLSTAEDEVFVGFKDIIMKLSSKYVNTLCN